MEIPHRSSSPTSEQIVECGEHEERDKRADNHIPGLFSQYHAVAAAKFLRAKLEANRRRRRSTYQSPDGVKRGRLACNFADGSHYIGEWDSNLRYVRAS